MNFTRGFIPAVTRGHAIVKKKLYKASKDLETARHVICIPYLFD